MASSAVDREMVRRHGFKHFIKIAWKQIEACELIWEPHMGLVGDHYEAVARGEITDLVVNVPPGTSKSVITQIMFPSWMWAAVDPGHKFMFVAYSEDLSHDFARRQLDFIQSKWFQERWPHVQVKRGARASVGDFWLETGGRRFSTMMGGKATGAHAHTLIVDDPHKPKDLDRSAESVAELLEQAWKDWVDTFSTRRADAKTFRRICIMQRLHEADIAGRMLMEPTTVGLVLPMEFEPARAYESPWGNDWRTTAGELLCPLRFPAEVIAKEKVRMTPRTYAAQHQQRPTPEQGSLFLREYFAQRWVRLPNGLKYLISVDASNKEGKDKDYFVAQVWGWTGATYYLVDQVRRQMAFSDQIISLENLKKKWPQVTEILIEDKANGPAIVDTLKRKIPGVIAVTPEGGKMARASAVEPTIRAMCCHFPAYATWMGEYVEEFASFPVASHDDQVDCTTQALLRMTGQMRNLLFKAAMKNARKLKAVR